MRFALATFALAALTLLAAAPAQAAFVTQVTGAGAGVASIDGCQAQVAIVFHLNFVGLESPVLFPDLTCDGMVNAFVNDCRQVDGGILCDGSYFDEGFLSITHEGVFHYERPLDNGLFTVDGLVAFNQAVVPFVS